MGIFQSLKNLFVRPTASPGAPPGGGNDAEAEAEAEPVVVPELSPAQVRAALAGEAPPVLLDVREQHEWNQVHIPDASFIPMNQVPGRLNELPRERQIVVLCAHGSRSYGVAHYLRQQGFDAANLTGGITQWQIQGGPVEVRRR